MQIPNMRRRQIRLQSPWAWLLVIPLLVLAFVLAIVFFFVALVSALLAPLFRGKAKRPPPQAGGRRVIDVEYVIDTDPDQP